MKNLLSLSWFKSEKKRELENLIIEGQKLQNDILTKELEKVSVPDARPCKTIKLVGDVLTVVFHDGSLVSKSNATVEDFHKAKAATSEYELLSIVSSTNKVKVETLKTEEVEIQQTIKALEGLEVLSLSYDFEIRDNSVYMKNSDDVTIERSLPALLVAEFARLLSLGKNMQIEEYQALKKFWLKCCLNPNAQSAEDLYTFLTHHQFRIDKHGNFYAYRNVVSLSTDNKQLVEFVSNTYNKIKAVWKKKPADFWVHKNHETGELTFSKHEFSDQNDLGNLEELYKNLPTMQIKNYTDSHTHTFDYKVGSSISMPRFDGDDSNNVSCSKGFHAASKAYDYSSFGDTPILVIINPMDVLAVPLGEVGKLRTCRWFFASILSQEEKYILDDKDFNVSELGDIFEEECQKDMANYVQNSFVEEVKRHTFQLPNISNREITSIVNSLEFMKKSISNRVSEI